MRNTIYTEIANERCNAAALGLYNAGFGDAVQSVTIDKGFHIRDTLVRPEEFNSLSDEKKQEILALKKEFDQMGYIDVRTQVGPDQWSRTTKRGHKQIEDKMLRTFRIEDRVKQLKKSDSQLYSDKKSALIKKAETRLMQSRSQYNMLKSFKKVQSPRMNGTKRAFLDAQNQMLSAEKALNKLRK